jgi:hypothetical protein
MTYVTKRFSPVSPSGQGLLDTTTRFHSFNDDGLSRIADGHGRLISALGYSVLDPGDGDAALSARVLVAYDSLQPVAALPDPDPDGCILFASVFRHPAHGEFNALPQQGIQYSRALWLAVLIDLGTLSVTYPIPAGAIAATLDARLSGAVVPISGQNRPSPTSQR